MKSDEYVRTQLPKNTKRVGVGEEGQHLTDNTDLKCLFDCSQHVKIEITDYEH